ncbi:MAG TPA: pentapeptide repeat-containing protein [Gemmatimonadaceae bacterium]|nr:pentapeptide repeat-containing protein [Gemmatimonadaceae bacterium]
MDIKNLKGDVLVSVDNDSLRDADLRGANLRGAYLCDANLGGANLGGANLGGANLRGAYLGGAYLGGANLGGANLRGANLGGANLCDADLGGANLRGADLGGANLRGAYLGGADLRGADLPVFSHVPDTGRFIGWKKLADGVIAKLEIPASAQRTSSLVGRKNRASKAKVLWLSNNAKAATSRHDGSVVYRVGEYVTPDSYDPDIRVECTHGIHFFITRAEAEAY